MLLLFFCYSGVCSSTSKALVCLSTSYLKQWIKLGLEFHMKLEFDVTDQGIFPSSPSHVRSVHLSQLNKDIPHALLGDAVLAAKTSSFRLRDILL